MTLPHPSNQNHSELKKLYFAKIKERLKKEDPQKNEQDIETEADTLFHKVFIHDKTKTHLYAKTFLKWYVNGSFQNETIPDILNYLECLQKQLPKTRHFEKDIPHEEKDLDYPTFEDLPDLK